MQILDGIVAIREQERGIVGRRGLLPLYTHPWCGFQLFRPLAVSLRTLGSNGGNPQQRRNTKPAARDVTTNWPQTVKLIVCASALRRAAYIHLG